MGCPITSPVPDTIADSQTAPRLPTVIADAKALSAFMADAMPGACIAYHVGALARDRYPGLSPLTNQRRRDLGLLADYALRLAEAGWAHLVQRRLAEERFLYLLVVRARRRRDAALSMPSVPTTMLAEAA